MKTSTGEIYYFTPPEQVKPAMTDLLDWYRNREAAGEHPIVIAATFHYQFVRIHPFDDGNGRMARLLMNLILIRHGYTVAIVQSDDRARYLRELEWADRSEDRTQFIEYIASCCTYALDLYLRAARGESIEDPEDIDREIARFKQSIVKSPGGDDRIALSQYVEAVARPFLSYFESKTESIISGKFANIFEPFVIVAGTRIDGETFHEDFRGRGALTADGVPEQVSKGTIVFLREAAKDFGTRKKCYATMSLIPLTRKIQPGCFECRSTAIGKRLEEYHGHDIHDLKVRFNDLLRYSIRIMQQWSLDAE